MTDRNITYLLGLLTGFAFACLVLAVATHLAGCDSTSTRPDVSGSCLPSPPPDDSDVAFCLVGLETGDNLLDCFVQALENRNQWIADAVKACGVRQ